MTEPAFPTAQKSINAGRISLLFFMLGFVLIYVLPLGVRPLVIPDETRYAEIPREMIVSRDWVVPHLDGLRYFEKPAMGYWLDALSIQAFGQNNFAVRLPSALATGLTALIVFLLTTAFAGGSGTGLLATAVFLTSLEVFCLGVISTLDSMLAFFLTSAVGSFFLAWHNRIIPARFYLFLLLSGISCGLACLIKGFLGMAVPLLTIVPFLIWQREWRSAVTTGAILIGLAILVMLPWGVAIHMREPDFWHFFFWNEHIRRFLSDNAQHKRSFFLFFAVLPFAVFPWTAALPAAMAGLKRNGLSSPFLRLTTCWLVFPFLFFSISSGKLLTYILPCFPPLTILIAVGLIKYFGSGKTALFNNGLKGLLGVILLTAVMVPVIQSGLLAPKIPVIETGKALFLFVSLLFFAAMLLFCLKAKSPVKKICLLTLAPVLLYFSSHFLLPEYIAREKAPGRFLEKHVNEVSDQTILISMETGIRAVCWYFKRDDVFLLSNGKGGELQYGLSYKDAANRKLSFSRFRELVTDSTRTAPIALIINESKFSRIKNELPAPIAMDTNGKEGFVFAVYQHRLCETDK